MIANFLKTFLYSLSVAFELQIFEILRTYRNGVMENLLSSHLGWVLLG